MGRQVVLVVSEDQAGDRLDHCLGANAPDLSRTRAREIIVSGLVTLNGSVVKPSARVAAGDTIVADVPELEHLAARPEDIPVVVCYEDDDLIVVDKAPGMVVHPAPGSTSGTLVNALLGRDARLSGVGGTLRPGIVHRIDKDTSGLIVVAKSDRVHRRLSAMFAERAVRKTYVALAWGRFGAEEGVIDEPIGRSRTDRKRMAVDPTGRPAVTHWRVREELGFATLLDVSPRTGRTHQIRVHLAYLRRPVVGDRGYGGVRRAFGDVPPHERALAKRLNARAARQALHARELSFEHPTTGRGLRFVSPIPEDFGVLLSLLRHPEGERGRVVGIDPGEARVGLAVSDEGRTIARPLEVLEGGSVKRVAAAIAEKADELEAQTIVVGHAVRMDGSVGARAIAARELAAAIENVSRATVVLRDERLSSAEAERVLRERGEKTRGRKSRIDEMAACMILQGYLDAGGAEGAR